VHSFDRPWVSGVLYRRDADAGLHLSHGLWLAVNDLGATGRRLRQVSVAVSGIVAVAVMVGNISLPVAVLTGWCHDWSSGFDELRVVGSNVDGGVPTAIQSPRGTDAKMSYRLVSPLNRRKFTVIVVGCGLAGAGCAAALGELGYQVSVSPTRQPTPRA